MSKYRFKTKEEFIRDGLWDDKYNVPLMWNEDGDMNGLLGQDISAVNNGLCDDNVPIYENGWWFSSCDYVLKEESKEINSNGFEYFGDTLMEVSDNSIHWSPRVVFGKKEGYYLAWTDAKTLEEAVEAYDPIVWKHARPIKTKLTLKQVADKFGLKEHEIEIVES